MSETLHNTSLSSLQSLILIKKNYVMALQRKIAFARNGFALKSEQQKNDVEVEIYESMFKINLTNKQIAKLESDFNEVFNEFTQDLQEMGEHYEPLLEIAKKSKEDEVKHLLYHVNWKFVNENVSEKLNFYKNLKSALAQIN